MTTRTTPLREINNKRNKKMRLISFVSLFLLACTSLLCASPSNAQEEDSTLALLERQEQNHRELFLPEEPVQCVAFFEVFANRTSFSNQNLLDLIAFAQSQGGIRDTADLEFTDLPLIVILLWNAASCKTDAGCGVLEVVPSIINDFIFQTLCNVISNFLPPFVALDYKYGIISRQANTTEQLEAMIADDLEVASSQVLMDAFCTTIPTRRQRRRDLLRRPQQQQQQHPILDVFNLEPKSRSLFLQLRFQQQQQRLINLKQQHQQPQEFQVNNNNNNRRNLQDAPAADPPCRWTLKSHLINIIPRECTRFDPPDVLCGIVVGASVAIFDGDEPELPLGGRAGVRQFMADTLEQAVETAAFLRALPQN